MAPASVAAPWASVRLSTSLSVAEVVSEQGVAGANGAEVGGEEVRGSWVRGEKEPSVLIGLAESIEEGRGWLLRFLCERNLDPHGDGWDFGMGRGVGFGGTCDVRPSL